MWRAQVAHLRGARRSRASPSICPGTARAWPRSSRSRARSRRSTKRCGMPRPAVRCCSSAHSMGGLLSIEYVGRENRRRSPASSPHRAPRSRAGSGSATYRVLARGFDSLPDRGHVAHRPVLDRTLPAETRADFGAGGYAFDAQDIALRSLSVLDLLAALHRIDVPLWFVNGQYDQLRVNERLFMQRRARTPSSSSSRAPPTSSRRCARASSTPYSPATLARSRRCAPPIRRRRPDRLGDWLACGVPPPHDRRERPLYP